MFKGRIISRSNINGKVHTFQKDFDDYDTYQTFLQENPEYSTPRLFDVFWHPWSHLGGSIADRVDATPAITSAHMPEGVDLAKYEKRRQEKKLLEREESQKISSLENSQKWLESYIDENPDDTEAQSDLQKIQQEIQSLR